MAASPERANGTPISGNCQEVKQKAKERGKKGMRKISKMYQWSKGADYRNVCKWCRNLVKVQQRQRTAYKCRIYGVTETPETDWQPQHIACKAFNLDYQGVPVIQGGQRKKKAAEDIEGQLSIADIPGVMPESKYKTYRCDPSAM